MIITFIRIFLLLVTLKSFHCQRRIVDGELIQYDRPYVVYLVKSPSSSQPYDAWMCGGALVSPNLIVTSAACVEDVQKMYAIAGYKYYRNDEYLDRDDCTRHVRKRVIKTCRPKAYELDYNKVEKWAFVDIAVATVESPYKFGEEGRNFFINCSYVPSIIGISYNKLYRKAGTIVSMFGWGHRKIWRQVDDHENYNQNVLNIAHTSVMDKEWCKKAYSSSAPQMVNVIERYMICTDGPPIMGEMEGAVDGCDDSLGRPADPSCYTGRRQNQREATKTIKPGICQNDHGGPLVHRVEGVEVLVGVASAFRIDQHNNCTGPYLFTSTACNSRFLSCQIKADLYRRSFGSVCNEPDVVKGYRLVEKHINWSQAN